MQNDLKDSRNICKFKIIVQLKNIADCRYIVTKLMQVYILCKTVIIN